MDTILTKKLDSLLIKNARYFDGFEYCEGDILSTEGVITALGKDLSAEVTYTVDASGMLVTPGLVDAHVHLKGISDVRYGTSADLATLPFGVTTCVEAGAHEGDKSLLLPLTAKASVIVSTHIENNHVDFTRTKELLAAYGDAAIGVKCFFDEEVSDLKDTTPLREICDFAHERGLLVLVHSSNAPVPLSEVVDTLSAGDILTHVYHGGGHTSLEDNFKCLADAKAKGIIVDAGMAGHVHTDFGILKTAIEQGALPEIISTDITCLSAFKRGGRYGMTQCMSIMRHLGMEEKDILRAVTSSAAKAVRKADVAGQIAVGRPADLAMFSFGKNGFDSTDVKGNHIECADGYICEMTVSDGEIVYRRIEG